MRTWLRSGTGSDRFDIKIYTNYVFLLKNHQFFVDQKTYFHRKTLKCLVSFLQFTNSHLKLVILSAGLVFRVGSGSVLISDQEHCPHPDPAGPWMQIRIRFIRNTAVPVPSHFRGTGLHPEELRLRNSWQYLLLAHKLKKIKIIYQKPNKMTFYLYCGSGMVYFRSGTDLF